MRIAVLADIHSNKIAFDLILNDLKSENVDKIVYLGDYITDGDDANNILDWVKQTGDIVLLGNREQYILDFDNSRAPYNNYKPILYTYNSLTEENKEYLKSLKKDFFINIDGLDILMIHGQDYYTGDNEMDYFFDKTIENNKPFDICLFAHSHIYKDITYKSKRFINPGSVGQAVDSSTYKYCILDTTKDNLVTLKEFDVKDTYKEVESHMKESKYYENSPVWASLVLDTIRDGYDHCLEFINLLSENGNVNKLGPEEFNKLWDETYEKYLKKI